MQISHWTQGRSIIRLTYPEAVTVTSKSEHDEMTPKFIPESDDVDAAVKIPARITSVAFLSSDVVELALALDRPLTYNAGENSLFFVRYNGQGNYSFARGSSPGVVNTMQFHVRKVPGGLFSEWLCAGNRAGEQVILEGPFGSFARIRPKRPSGHGRRTAGELGLCVRPALNTNT